MTSLTASTSFVFLPPSFSSSPLPPDHNLLFLPPLPPFVFPRNGEEEKSPGWPKIGRRTRRRRKRGVVVVGGGGGSRRRKKILAAEAEDAFAIERSSVDLERQVFEFMRNSGRPNDFPTKAELVAAGRADLVEAVSKHGGWLAFGWDLDRDDGIEKADLELLLQNGRFHADDSVHQETVSEDPNAAGLSFIESEDHSASSSSGRSLEMENIEDSGVEGIINRLERERRLAFSMDSKGKEASTEDWMNAPGNSGDAVLFNRKRITSNTGRNIMAATSEWNIRTAASKSNENFSQNSNGGDAERGNLRDLNGRKNVSSDMQRNWSVQGLGFPEKDADIPSVDVDNMLEHDNSENSVASDIETSESSYDKHHIRACLQHLEEDLASTLHSLRSSHNNENSDKGQESSVDELHSLSDAWEFQETEIMNARDKLRSIRAKLAILEGKMALEMIQAQKILEEKQRRLNATKHALSLLRTVCIVWPNNASEVLLAGSFDGWTSERRMERSDSGIFSLHLKLYPGRYEIKFIVDDVWKVDPLRPIVHNNGHENNLLTVT